MLDQSAVESFSASLRGDVIQPSDPEFEKTRKVYNAMIDRKPRLIARCVNIADVIRAVEFGREHDLLTSVRGGGHNAGGLGVCDNGLMIDLSGIKYTRIDPSRQTVRVGGGNTWGEVDHATHAFGLAVPAGIISTTGVAGLTLGGGLGHLTRKYALTIDNLLEADLVLADGSFVTASADQNADLFWAIRGGGGNFGVVTSFLFQAHPVKTIYGGPMFWEMDRAVEVMQWYRDFITQAPDEINGFLAFLNVPPVDPFPEHLRAKTVCGIVWCYTGPLKQAEEAFKPIRSAMPAAMDGVGPMPHPMLQSMFDGFYPPGLNWYWKADFVNELSDEAINQHMRFGSELPTLLSTMHLYPIDGAASRVDTAATPWQYRDAKWAMVIVGVDQDPASNGPMTAWARAYWEALHPHSAGGAYVNFLMEEGQDRVKATYGQHYDKLVEIKKRYDPDNFFRVNQNIDPDGSVQS